MHIILLLSVCVWFESGRIMRYTPTSVYLPFWFIGGDCGSALLRVAGGRVEDMFPNSIKRGRAGPVNQMATVVTILSAFTRININSGISDNNTILTTPPQASDLCLCFSRMNLATNRYL